MKNHSKISLFLFIICAFGADGDGVKRVSVMEGDSVTLNPGLREPFDLIQWRFEDSGSIIVEITLYKTGMPRFYLSDERFRDRLQVNDQTGSLIISNMRITDSGLYELWIHHRNEISYEPFSVTVYGFNRTKSHTGLEQHEVPDSGLSPGAVAGIVIAVVSMLAAAAAGLYYKCSLDKKRTLYAKKRESVALKADVENQTAEEILERDHQTRSLKTTDSGDYKLQIKPSSKDKEKTESAKEGESVALKTDAENQTAEEILELDHQTGSLKTTDSGDYKLQIKPSSKGSDTMSGIVPKSKTKGIDICRGKDYCYIIRSDLGCYMQTSDLNKGSDISIFSLHPACKDGDHYLGTEDGEFFIIKGNNYRRVKNLTTDSEAEVQSLHPNCRGGDHYFANFGYFYIIFQGKGTFRRTSSLKLGSDAVENNLHSSLRNGLYYWGLPSFHQLFSFLKPASEWGVEYYTGTDFIKDDPIGVYSVHPDVVNFLPGGLSVTKGTAFGIWENIKTITNDSNTPVTWTKKINKKVGYNKEKMTQITKNWKIDTSVSIETGALAKLITKCQFSFSAEYGGSHVSTENESWNEMTEEEEQLSFELKPNKSLYLWQYKLRLGEEPVLFCRDLKIDDEPNPPTEVPLPPAQS